ncbi:uncharacterized protein UV8b_01589 [Ustilaginoidea virens]|uniref:Uncharacterized protein n=1 Tax=Ustilaginoidea virens TaxID=1159556 RepID=A0A8E5HL70_USTVR|nr:uncharacterized protein UV8b_01589 [Ustilaginoidea virens]QUC17348.1 hypothetical protein UV8b_01589 [Ustilaginoidea virens]
MPVEGVTFACGLLGENFRPTNFSRLRQHAQLRLYFCFALARGLGSNQTHSESEPFGHFFLPTRGSVDPYLTLDLAVIVILFINGTRDILWGLPPLLQEG